MGNCNTKKYEPNNGAKSPEQIHSRNKGASIHDGSILGLTRYNNKIITASDDQRIAVIDAQLWQKDIAYEPKYFVGHKKAVNRVTMLGDSCWSISRDLSVRQWNMETYQQLQVFEDAHSLNIAAIAAHSNNRSRIFTGSRDYTVKGWDVESGKSFVEFKAPRNIVTTMQFNHSTAGDAGNNENLLFQGSEDLCIRVWDVRQSSSSQPALHITGYVYFPLCLDFHSNGHLLASGCKGFDSVGCEVKLMDLRNTSKFVKEFKGHSHDVSGVSFERSAAVASASDLHESSSDLLYSISKDGSVIARDVRCDAESSDASNHVADSSSSGGALVASLLTGKNLTCLGAAQLSEGQSSAQLAVGATDGSLLLVSLREAVSAAGNPGGGNSRPQLTVDFSSREFFDPSAEDGQAQ